MNYDSYVNNNNDATSTGHCGVHVTLRLVSGTDDELAAQILATLSTTPPAPQSLALLNGHELLKRQLNEKKLVVGMQVGLRWYNTLVQVVVEKMELLLEDIDNTSNATTSNDNSGVDALTLYMNRLNIKSKQMAVITSVVVDKTVQFTMELPQSIQAFEELSIMAQQIYTRLASMVKAMNSLTRLNMKSSPILLITGAVDQQYTQQHIREAAHQLQLRLFTYSVVKLYYRQLDDAAEEGKDVELWRTLHMALSTAPAVLLLTGIDLLAKNINTESDASHRVIKQLTTAFAKLHGDTRLIIVCVASHPDKLPSELGRWLEQRLVLAPLDRIKRATLIKQIWSTEIETDQSTVAQVAQMLSGDNEQEIRRLCRHAALLHRITPCLPQNTSPLLMKAAYELHPPVSSLLFEPVLFPRRDRPLVGYKKIRQQLNRLLSLALIHPEVSVRFGVKPPSGALLYGPPGCGKTWLAKEIIGQLGMHVIVARGTQLFSKYFGETEERLRQLFRAARQHAPCIVFLDEVDALGTQRDLTDGEAGGKVQERLLSTLLNEMDGISGNTGLFVLACTNRPDRVDDALLRPGRLDHLLYVNLPNKGDRAAILQWHATSFTCPQVDWDLIAEETESFTCGGLAQLVREAALLAIRETRTVTPVLPQHFMEGIKAIGVSARKGMNMEMVKAYQRFNQHNEHH